MSGTTGFSSSEGPTGLQEYDARTVHSTPMRDSEKKETSSRLIRRIVSVPRQYLVATLFVFLVLSVYWQVGGHSFILVDDSEYIFENDLVLRGLTREGISWAFTTFHAGNWHPLTWLSHMVDVELFGPSPGWHHRMNVLFHLLNTELLFFVLWRMTGGLWRSAFVAALFGVHPLHVESVAWISERKDVLSALFWILTMGAYLRYVQHPGVARYLIVALFFVFGLLCKPMLVTLPFMLLILDFWPLRRMTSAESPTSESLQFSLSTLLRLVREKLPLFGLSISSCVITILAQARSNTVAPLVEIPLRFRILNVFESYVTYLWKTVWPASLAALYPHPAFLHAVIPAWKIAASLVLIAGFSFVALWQVHRRPYLAVGWLWFIGTLVPVIGLVQVGAQAMADRYTYIPLIGVFVAVVWGISAELVDRGFRPIGLGLLGGALLLVLSTVAWNQTGYWRNTVTLYSRAVAVTENNWIAWNTLGVGYYELGQTREAIACYREALRIKPDYALPWNNLGRAYDRLGQLEHAIACYREAIRLKPDDAFAWNGIGVAYDKLGQGEEAIESYREALRIRPDLVEAWENIGLAYAGMGRVQEAISNFRKALHLKPDSAIARNDLGVAYETLGQIQEAIAWYREALRIKPDFALAWENMGRAYDKLGRTQEAVACYREAERLGAK